MLRLFARLSLARGFSTSVPAGIKRVGVVGSGQMGNGIALVAALRAQLDVTMLDVNQTALDKAMAFSKKLLDKDVSKGRITQDEADAAFGRFSTTTSYDDMKDCDFVVEAATENLDIKLDIMKQLDAATRDDVILATNTSSISITKIAAAVERPENVIGMHFMNPVPVMKLVEIINGLATSEATYETTIALSAAMGKTTTKSDDMPGFIANRILMPYINEAVYTLQDGVASVEDIDTTMKLGTNVPMGPLTLADFIGLDTCLAIMRTLHNDLGDTKYRPCPLLVKYVDAGWLGKKSGRGFYKH